MKNSLAAIVRPLEGVEIAMAAMHQHQFGTTQATQCLYLNCDIPAGEIVAVVKFLFSKFQFLRCSIVSDVDNYYFKEDVSVGDIEVLQYSIEYSQLNDLIYELCDKPLIQSISLWRIVKIALKDTNISLIVMSVAHAIIDNEGMYTLAREFLNCLDNLRSGVEVELGFDTIVAKSINHYLKVKNNQINSAHYFKKLSHKMRTSRSERRTAGVLKVLDESRLAGIKLFADAHKLKIHSLIASSLCLAAKNSPFDSNVIELNTAISLRAVAQGQELYQPLLGCYIGVSNLAIDNECKDILGLAKSYQKDLMNDIVKNRMRKLVINRKNVESFALSLDDADEFVQGMGITNLGEVGIREQYTTFSLENYFSVVNRTAGNLSVVLHCYEFKRRMYLNFVYTYPLIEKNTIENFADSVVNILNAMK